MYIYENKKIEGYFLFPSHPIHPHTLALRAPYVNAIARPEGRLKVYEDIFYGFDVRLIILNRIPYKIEIHKNKIHQTLISFAKGLLRRGKIFKVDF